MGYIIPNMGLVTSNLGDALFPSVKQFLLSTFFLSPDQTFYTNELIKLAGRGNGAVQRELARLGSAGLILVTKVGNQTHYQANHSSPIFTELRGLVVKTFGLGDVVRNALAPLHAQIEKAFIFGSIAKGEDTPMSDVDLMVISETLSYSDFFSALETAALTLERTINPTVYTPGELAKRIAERNSFVERIMEQPKIWIKGEEHYG